MPLLCPSNQFHSMPLRLVSRPGPTVLVLIRSARFHGPAVQCLRITFLGYACALPNVALPFHFFATLGNSIPLPNLTFPLHCISFLFHRISRLINAVAHHCIAFPMLFPAKPFPLLSAPFHCFAVQCRYLKIVVGLWLISCQTKAPLPELRHCPRPLNRP